MKRYLYNYQTIVTFSEPISGHAVLLRCQPAANDFQTIEQEHIVAPPDYRLTAGTDAFGNRILFGGSRSPRSVFAYVSTGIVAIGKYSQKHHGEPLSLYLQPSRLTATSEAMRAAAAAEPGLTVMQRAVELCHRVFGLMEYVPESTTVDTPACDVFIRQCGVCQDYAHLMIAFCRANGIPARYVNGFLKGTGATHAWVEVFDGCAWQGFDPTHDCQLVGQGYVKLAHGRDSADCAVSRGMFCGRAVQQTQINVTLQEL
ncbi:MAG: transglutaminase family protein [Bacteroidales bacterium]|nr:transglutaminase family protein [Bacteroidales bacterium]